MLQRYQSELQRLDDAARREGRITYPPQPLEPRASTQIWLLTALIFTLCWLIKGWPWLSGAVTIPWDAKAHFQAQIAFMAQSLARGESPFWAPQVFAGHPQIADPQSMLFSPPHLLLAWLSPSPSLWAVDLTTYLILLFGGLGLIGFGRDKHWHPAAALVAALAFAMAGTMHWRNQHTGQIFSIAYLPWALWMLDRALRLSSRRYGALAGLFSALILLDPDQIAYLSLVTLAALVVVHWAVGPGRRDRLQRSFQPLAAGAVVGLVLTLVPTLMVLSFAEMSNRARFTLADADLGSLHPSSLLTFVISNLFLTNGPQEAYWGAPSVHWPYIVNSWLSRNMTNFYMGLLPLAGIVLWLGNRAAYSRRNMLYAGLFIAMILYALGRYTPFFTLLFEALPGVNLFRRPADALFNVTAMGAVLAGFGLTALLNGRIERPRLAFGLLGGVLVSGLIGGIGMAIWLGKLGQSGHEIAIAAFGITALGGVLWAGLRYGKSHPQAVMLLFAAMMALDLGWNLRPCDSTGLSPERYEALRPGTTDETIRALQKRIVRNGERRDRVELTGLGFDMPNVGLIHDIENTLGYNPLRVKHFAIATGAGDHVAGVDQHKFGPLFTSYRSVFANLMGLRFIAIGLPIENADPAMKNNPLPLVARTKDAYIYENTEAFPRVMVVPEAQITDQDQLVTSGQWPSTDLRRVAFVERTALPLPRARATGSATGTAQITRYGNAEITIAVQTARPAVLVLNDVWHPWWFAEIDGKRTPVLRTNGAFRSVILPAGAREVVFRFEPIRGLIRTMMAKVGLMGSNG